MVVDVEILNGHCETWNGRYGWLQVPGHGRVFLHANQFWGAITPALLPGDHVEFQMGFDRGGRRCAERARVIPRGRQGGPSLVAGDVRHGVCMRWLARGFGFLRVDSVEVYVHATQLPVGVSRLLPGQLVRFRVGDGRDGTVAAFDVVLQSPVPGEASSWHV